MNETDVPAAAQRLLSQIGIDAPPNLERLAGGSNNRVFKVDVGGRAFCLKVYFRHPADSRDRLRTEFDFATFAWTNGVRTLPQPLAFDAAQSAGLFEFVSGRRLTPADVDAVSAWLASQPVPRDARAPLQRFEAPLRCGSLEPR